VTSGPPRGDFAGEFRRYAHRIECLSTPSAVNDIELGNCITRGRRLVGRASDGSGTDIPKYVLETPNQSRNITDFPYFYMSIEVVPSASNVLPGEARASTT
jgi:hypothetical protein